MKEFWNDRYSKEAFAYGKEPNQFFKEELDKLKPGKILLPADGEGRNAVYAAKKGWDVFAFDNSEEGQKKALRLAKEENVAIRFEIIDVRDFHTDEQFDVIALIFTHFPEEIRKSFHASLPEVLKDNGIILAEYYNKKQLPNKTEGPQTIDMLYSKEILSEEFSSLNIQVLEDKELEINEGIYHNGKSNVVRMIAEK